MEILLLAIYSLIVWLLFFKFKVLPWTPVYQAIVVLIPIVAMSALILVLNVVAPSTSDVRVFKYVVQVVPQVRGRVIEVPVTPNRLVKKGEVLLRIDPTLYANDVATARARLAAAEAKQAQARAGVSSSDATVRQQQAELDSATEQVRALTPRLELARKRVAQNSELVSTGAGDRFALEAAQANARELEAQIAAASANRQIVAQKLSGLVDGVQAQVAAARAEFRAASAEVEAAKAALATAEWNLEQTVIKAPADGYAINVQVRPGSMIVPVPLAPAMAFVEESAQVIALFDQNELRQVAPGDEAEIALPMYPGRIIKAEVDSIVWAQGRGQLAPGGILPETGAFPQVPGRFPVKLTIAESEGELFLAAGAQGKGAIYTQHGAIIHIVRKVIMRVGSITNYFVLKLH